ncbi:MAG: NUDIX hydrolase [Fluviicola sp.]|nr:MAG: NUDIX hydrolase [Fluviicola sp.]
MYKVFVDNIPIYFEKEMNFHSNLPNKYFPVLAPEKYNNLVKHINSLDKNNKIIVQSSKPYSTLKRFFSDFKYLEASGGLVYNPLENKYLFIKRNGFWDIPKGKIEKGEEKEHAAIREVREECGFNEILLKDLITETYHTYFAHGKHHLKRTFWYSMESSDIKHLTPQFEEGISELIWLKKEEWNMIRQNTFKSISVVLDIVQKSF